MAGIADQNEVCDDFTYCGATMANLNLEPMISMRNGID